MLLKAAVILAAVLPCRRFIKGIDRKPKSRENEKAAPSVEKAEELPSYGEQVAEWFNALDLKSSRPPGLVGSIPPCSPYMGLAITQSVSAVHSYSNGGPHPAQGTDQVYGPKWV